MAFTKINAAGIGTTERVTVDGLTVINNLSVGGTVSIAGTLTYEDVTNVDSVGIITARSTIDAQGDISIADKIIHSGDTNTAIRFPAADTFSVETGGSQRLNIGSSGNVNIITGDLVLPDVISHKEDLNTKIRFPAADTITAETAGSERLRIDSSGSVRIENTDYSALASGNELIVGTTTGDNGITIASGSSGTGNIYFGDGDSNSSGYIRYDHNDNFLKFNVNGSERVRINSAGKTLIGDSTARDFDGGNNPLLQLSSSTSGIWARMSSTFYGDSNIGGGIILAHSRNTTIGSHTIVQDDDKLGSIFFEGSDGTNFERSAAIECYVDGTPGNDDMPGRLEFRTTAENTTDLVTNLVIDESGRLIAASGRSTPRTNFKMGTTGNAQTPTFQFETANSDEDNSLSLTFGRNNAQSAEIFLAKHRSATIGGTTIVQNDDKLGAITFSGSDGTNFIPAASIKGVVNAAPGSNDMPGSLVFATTADGAASPTDRIRLNRNGIFDFINSGTGINFAAGHSVTPNDATVVNNVFDDFEEGELDWEIHKADYLTTGSNTAGSKVTYQKIGSMVHVQGYIRTDGTSPAGISNKAAILTDASGNRAQLPFTPSSAGHFIVTFLRSFNDHTTAANFCIGWDANNDDVYVNRVLSNNYKASQGDNATTTNQTNLVISFTGHYHTND